MKKKTLSIIALTAILGSIQVDAKKDKSMSKTSRMLGTDSSTYGPAQEGDMLKTPASSGVMHKTQAHEAGMLKTPASYGAMHKTQAHEAGMLKTPASGQVRGLRTAGTQPKDIQHRIINMIRYIEGRVYVLDKKLDSIANKLGISSDDLEEIEEIASRF